MFRDTSEVPTLLLQTCEMLLKASQKCLLNLIFLLLSGEAGTNSLLPWPGLEDGTSLGSAEPKSPLFSHRQNRHHGLSCSPEQCLVLFMSPADSGREIRCCWSSSFACVQAAFSDICLYVFVRGRELISLLKQPCSYFFLSISSGEETQSLHHAFAFWGTLSINP